MDSAQKIKLSLLAAMLAKSSLDMLSHTDLMVVRLQLQRIAKDFKALVEHVEKLR